MLSAIPSNHSISSYSITHHNESIDKNDNLEKEGIALKIKISDRDVSQEEQKKIQSLKARDQEVRTHEQAHLSAAGGLATGGASFSFQDGPDGISYAIGGEVNIDTSTVSGDAAATLRKAETIKRAALAPASPSSQDIKVARQASAMANKAMAEIFQENKQFSDNEVKQEENNNNISFSV
ncbi:MAG: hypothetical protein L3J59_08075 [Methylococcaceae bacterium]|nr:hypothetical protein [Methylococcaceae bacterium]